MISKHLMTALHEHGKARGLSQLELTVNCKNGRAIGFYEKMGFERLYKIPDDIRIDTVSHDSYFYRKLL